MKKRGRPSALTPEVEKTIVNAIRAGSMIDAACSMAGIGKTTFYRWMAQAEEGGAKNEQYWEFRDKVKKSLASAEVSLVVAIREAGKTSWQANAWLLERRWRKTWGRNAQDEPTRRVSDTPPVVGRRPS
ncbi:MAG: hypothetical protein NTV52_33650 [Acidobacteria bacterium]|nr:hypothetical protein [Acidobacteriota bacterium]